MKKLFWSILSFYFSFLTFHLPPTFASEPPSIAFREIQPLSTPDSVILECLAETDLSQIIVSDLDGADTPITPSSTTCSIGETVQLLWDTVMPTETKADHTFLSIDTSLTNTKDQIVLQALDGTLLDAVIYWDGTSTFASTTEQPDIDKILTAELWSGGNNTDALTIEVGTSMRRTNETHEKTSWEEGNWERPADDTEDSINIDDDSTGIIESDEYTETDEGTNTNQDTDPTPTEEEISDSTDTDTSIQNNEEHTPVFISEGNEIDPIESINTTIYHSTDSSKKLNTVLSPQTNYANEPTRWSLPDDYGLYISSVIPQSSKKDFVRFFNPTKSEKNLSSYILSANNKKILLPRLSMKPQSYADAFVELPNTKAKLYLFIEGIQVQEIGYESSKKDENFVFSKEIGLWKWNKTLETPSEIEAITRAKKGSVLGTQIEEKKTEEEKIPALETHESSGPPGGFPVAEAANVPDHNAPVEILKTNYVWYAVGIGILSVFALMSPRILRSIQKFLPQEETTMEMNGKLNGPTSDHGVETTNMGISTGSGHSSLDLSSFSIQMKQNGSSPYKSSDTSTVASIIERTIPIQAFG